MYQGLSMHFKTFTQATLSSKAIEYIKESTRQGTSSGMAECPLIRSNHSWLGCTNLPFDRMEVLKYKPSKEIPWKGGTIVYLVESVMVQANDLRNSWNQAIYTLLRKPIKFGKWSLKNARVSFFASRF